MARKKLRLQQQRTAAASTTPATPAATITPEASAAPPTLAAPAAPTTLQASAASAQLAEAARVRFSIRMMEAWMALPKAASPLDDAAAKKAFRTLTEAMTSLHSSGKPDEKTLEAIMDQVASMFEECAGFTGFPPSTPASMLRLFAARGSALPVQPTGLNEARVVTSYEFDPVTGVALAIFAEIVGYELLLLELFWLGVRVIMKTTRSWIVRANEHMTGTPDWPSLRAVLEVWHPLVQLLILIVGYGVVAVPKAVAAIATFCKLAFHQALQLKTKIEMVLKKIQRMWLLGEKGSGKPRVMATNTPAQLCALAQWITSHQKATTSEDGSHEDPQLLTLYPPTIHVQPPTRAE